MPNLADLIRNAQFQGNFPTALNARPMTPEEAILAAAQAKQDAGYRNRYQRMRDRLPAPLAGKGSNSTSYGFGGGGGDGLVAQILSRGGSEASGRGASASSAYDAPPFTVDPSVLLREQELMDPGAQYEPGTSFPVRTASNMQRYAQMPAPAGGAQGPPLQQFVGDTGEEVPTRSQTVKWVGVDPPAKGFTGPRLTGYEIGPKGETNQLAVDLEGRFKRDLGRKAGISGAEAMKMDVDQLRTLARQAEGQRQSNRVVRDEARKRDAAAVAQRVAMNQMVANLPPDQRGDVVRAIIAGQIANTQGSQDRASRERIAQMEANTARQQHQATMYAALLGIINDPNAQPGARQRAQYMLQQLEAGGGFGGGGGVGQSFSDYNADQADKGFAGTGANVSVHTPRDVAPIRPPGQNGGPLVFDPTAPGTLVEQGRQQPSDNGGYVVQGGSGNQKGWLENALIKWLFGQKGFD